jgi:excisionase family DNA binding protein
MKTDNTVTHSIADVSRSAQKDKIGGILPLNRQRILRVGKAAKYIGVHPQTLRKITDEGTIKAVRFGEASGERRYAIEELDRYLTSLRQWYYGDGERSGASHGDQN